MLAVAFDTLKLAQKLERGGMPAKQAQDMSASLSESFTEWLSVGNVATREDVQLVKSSVREDLLKLEVKMEARFSALDTKVSDTKADIIKWMVGQNALILLAIFGLLHSLAR